MPKSIPCQLILHGASKELNGGTFPSKAAAKKYVSECWDRPYTIVPLKPEKKQTPEETHKKLVELFSTIEGSKGHYDNFQNPNPYGDVTSTIGCKYGFWKKGSGSGYSLAEISLNYKTKVLFIPLKGYFTFEKESFSAENIFKKFKENGGLS